MRKIWRKEVLGYRQDQKITGSKGTEWKQEGGGRLLTRLLLINLGWWYEALRSRNLRTCVLGSVVVFDASVFGRTLRGWCEGRWGGGRMTGLGNSVGHDGLDVLHVSGRSVALLALVTCRGRCTG